MKHFFRYRLILQILAAIALAIGLSVFPNPLKIGFTLLVISTGVFYCGWLCPMGLLQDLGQRMATVFHIKQQMMPEKIHSTLVYARYILLGLTVFYFTDALAIVLGYEPRGRILTLLIQKTLPSIAVFIVILFLALSIFFKRIYCRYFCTEGARLGLLSIFRLWTIKRNVHSCVQCGKCDKVCPMQISVSKIETLRSPQCINCMECVSACPIEKTLNYSFCWSSKK